MRREVEQRAEAEAGVHGKRMRGVGGRGLRLFMVGGAGSSLVGGSRSATTPTRGRGGEGDGEDDARREEAGTERV